MSDNDKQQGPDNGGGNPWMKSLLIWVGILAALALFVTIFDKNNAPAPGDAVAYSDFMAKVNNGEVKSVNISRATGVVSGELSNGGKFRTNAPEVPR